MFASIKDALEKTKTTTGLKDILRLDAGATYQVRIIPNIKDPSATFYHYYNHGWKSVSTGQFVSAISPTTWGEPDPIASTRFKDAKEGSDEVKEKAKLLNRRENWLANVFVVSDPKHPDNTGKIKILRFGRQLYKIIMDAVAGEDAAELGQRIFDLTADGVNLKIKAEKQGEFTTFVSSKFGSASEIPGLTPEKIQETYNGIFDLTKVFTVKSYAELQTMVDEHYHGTVKTKGTKQTETAKETTTSVETPAETDETPAETAPVTTESVPAATADVLDDNKVKELLSGLD